MLSKPPWAQAPRDHPPGLHRNRIRHHRRSAVELLTDSAHPAPASRQASLGHAKASLLRQRGTPRIVRRHEPVYSIGDPATHVYLLERGEITLSRVTPEGRELILESLGAGDLFGETELLLGRPRTSQALARTECVVYLLYREALLALVAEQPDFGLWLVRRMGARQTRLQERMETLLFASAGAKVAQVLLGLAERHGKNTAEGLLIDYPITHQEIGNLIATTRETVSYTFMDFRDRGLIATHQRKTVIRDQDALAQIALA
jgi:CRP/FNR family transcriptional regulator